MNGFGKFNIQNREKNIVKRFSSHNLKHISAVFLEIRENLRDNIKVKYND